MVDFAVGKSIGTLQSYDIFGVRVFLSEPEALNFLSPVKLVFDYSRPYSTTSMNLTASEGADFLSINAGAGQIASTMKIYAGSGDDQLRIGHIEGVQGTGSGVFGQDGNDYIEVLATVGSVGIWGNGRIVLDGGAGNDTFNLGGIQLNFIGTDGPKVDGGVGFDTLVWNGLYDLGLGTNQTGADASDARREILVQSIEELKISKESGSITLASSDVRIITSGSDFDRSDLGVGQSGIGNTLFIGGEGAPRVSLNGWEYVGQSTEEHHSGWSVFSQDDALLVVAPAGMVATQVVKVSAGDTIWLAISDLFMDSEDISNVTLFGSDGEQLVGETYDPASGHIFFTASTNQIENYIVQKTDLSGAISTIQIAIDPVDLDFVHVSTTSPFRQVAIEDFDGDGINDVFGLVRNVDGFATLDVNDAGISVILESRNDRDHRLVDFDNDGDLDLISTTYELSSQSNSHAFLFENVGNFQFVERGEFSDQNIQGFGETITVADFNNDGLSDLFLPYYFRNEGDREVAGSRLLINQGGLQFVDETSQWNVIGSTGSLSLKGFDIAWSSVQPEGAQAFDLNKDGLIDLFVGSHLFLNVGSGFVDANSALGLPVQFEEGAAFFDWNGDGWLDHVRVLPDRGLELYTFDEESGKFIFDNVIPFSNPNEAYGLGYGDLNGDGWIDLFINGGTSLNSHVYLNRKGEGFDEFRSADLLDRGGIAGVAITDITGDGIPDIVFGSNRGYAEGLIAQSPETITVTLLGPNGERNQHGRIVEFRSDDSPGEVQVRIVDGGSGYMVQQGYAVTLASSAPKSYTVSVYTIDFSTGVPLELRFVGVSGEQYSVFAAAGSNPPLVIAASTGENIDISRYYAQSPFDDRVDITAPGKVFLGPSDGNDQINLSGGDISEWTGTSIETGNDADTLNFNPETNSGTGTVSLATGAGDDAIFLGVDARTALSGLTVHAGSGADKVEAFGFASRGELSIIDLGEGDDAFLAGSSQNLAAANGSNVAVLGGLGDDSFTFAGAMGSVEFTIAGGGGFDRLKTSSQNLANPALDQNISSIEFFEVYDSAKATSLVIDAARISTWTTGSDFLQSDLSVGLSGLGKSLFLTANGIDIIINGKITALGNFSFGDSEYLITSLDDTILVISGLQLSKYGLTFYVTGDDVTIHGTRGDDTYIVDAAGDIVIETAGGGTDKVIADVSYILAAGSEIETLSSRYHRGTENINLTGNEFAQTIYGNFGNNILDGRGGNDTLQGFSGADTFLFSTQLVEGTSVTIIDFQSGVDKFELHQSIFSNIDAGLIGKEVFHSGTVAENSQQRIIYDSQTGSLSYDSDGSGDSKAIVFAKIQPGADTISASDFVVVAHGQTLTSMASASRADIDIADGATTRNLEVLSTDVLKTADISYESASVANQLGIVSLHAEMSALELLQSMLDSEPMQTFDLVGIRSNTPMSESYDDQWTSIFEDIQSDFAVDLLVDHIIANAGYQFDEIQSKLTVNDTDSSILLQQVDAGGPVSTLHDFADFNLLSMQVDVHGQG